MATASRPADVFLNIPFAESHEFLYISLVAGLVALRLNPRCVLEIPPQESRLQRLYQLIGSCPYSIHDLSHVSLSNTGHRVPRFNMAFELGIAVAVALSERGRKAHQFRIFEARPYRLQQSLSDVLGHDPYIHRSSADGVLEALLDVFSDLPESPEMREMRRVCRMDVATCGFPLGNMLFTQLGTVAGSFSRGIVSSIIPTAGGSREHVTGFQLDLKATHGNSGGPVFSWESGRVFGVLQGGIDDQYGHPLFSRAESVYRLMDAGMVDRVLEWPPRSP